MLMGISYLGGGNMNHLNIKFYISMCEKYIINQIEKETMTLYPKNSIIVNQKSYFARRKSINYLLVFITLVLLVLRHYHYVKFVTITTKKLNSYMI